MSNSWTGEGTDTQRLTFRAFAPPLVLPATLIVALREMMAEEREACAKVAEGLESFGGPSSESNINVHWLRRMQATIAAAIRARGEA